MIEMKPFRWPNDARAALSLSFDDARPSQISNGVPVLNRHGLRATFYVLPSRVNEDVKGWKSVVEAGHEIGNHTVSHPCSGNFQFSRHNALEDLTLGAIDVEMTQANEEIRALLGVTPKTFAYPCGQKFVGRGKTVTSYVPLVAEKFLVGRGFNDERHNDPAFCDLAQVYGRDFDCLEFDAVKKHLDEAIDEGGWLILVGHDVGDGDRQTVLSSTLEQICKHVCSSSPLLWMDTVSAVGEFIGEYRKCLSR